MGKQFPTQRLDDLPTDPAGEIHRHVIADPAYREQQYGAERHGPHDARVGIDESVGEEKFDEIRQRRVGCREDRHAGDTDHEHA